MSVEVLLLTRDLSLVNVVRRVCDDGGIVVHCANEAAEAEDMLGRRKFDGLIADCDEIPSSISLLKKLRKGVSNRSAIVFAIRNGSGISTREAFENGANFVLDKPVNVDRASRCLRAAHGLLIRERRRYFRVPAEIPVDLTFSDGAVKSAVIANISEGGMSVRSIDPIPSRTTVKFSFVLPGTRTKIDAKGEVSWTLTSPAHRSGVHFIYLSDDAQRELAMWLNSELQSADPALLFSINRAWNKPAAKVSS